MSIYFYYYIYFGYLSTSLFVLLLKWTLIRFFFLVLSSSLVLRLIFLVLTILCELWQTQYYSKTIFGGSITLCLAYPFYPFHFILIYFIFFNFSNLANYFISFHIFSTIFFNFPNPYTISLNLNHLYHLEINKIKSFLHYFYKLFSNYSKLF